MSDLEYLLKRWSANEVSLIFGVVAQKAGRSKWDGSVVQQTGGSQAVASYGIQFAARSVLAVEAAYRTSIWQKMRAGQPALDREFVIGTRWLR